MNEHVSSALVGTRSGVLLKGISLLSGQQSEARLVAAATNCVDIIAMLSLFVFELVLTNTTRPLLLHVILIHPEQSHSS